jgi:hypothetical protein
MVAGLVEVEIDRWVLSTKLFPDCLMIMMQQPDSLIYSHLPTTRGQRADAKVVAGVWYLIIHPRAGVFVLGRVSY